MNDYSNTPAGRALEVFDWLVEKVNRQGFTFDDVHSYLNSSIPVENELRWRAVSKHVFNFKIADRYLVLKMLKRYSKTGLVVTDAFRDKKIEKAVKFEPDDPFEGIPNA